MKTTRIFYVLIGFLLTTFSVEACGRKILNCVEPSKANDGEHGQVGENGKNGKSGGHGGNGGSSIYGEGGNGGNGGDSD